MPFQEEEATGGQLRQQERCARFASEAAERIRSDEKCLFSLLPHQELSRLAGEWYDACAQAMLRGNYAPIDKWIRSQSRLATAQGFASEDILQLLFICRRSAIETESWDEAVFSAVDEVMGEVFGSVHPNTRWNVGAAPEINNKDATTEVHTDAQSAKVEEWTTDRRRFTRNRLRFPIRVTGSAHQRQIEEFTETQSVSRGGLYFVAREEYENEQLLKIGFPYWSEPGGINLEYSAKVVRVDGRPDSTWGIGVDFLESLGRKSD